MTYGRSAEKQKQISNTATMSLYKLRGYSNVPYLKLALVLMMESFYTMQVFFKDFRINVINFRWILNLEFRKVLILEPSLRCPSRMNPISNPVKKFKIVL
jgi:hypothetical protein